MPLSVLSIEENLIKYSKEKFPEREEIEIHEITSLAKGWETELFSFIYRYKQEEEEIERNLILRIYPGSNLEEKTKWEFSVLRALFNAGYPVPETHMLELDTGYFGYPFIVMERIIGKDMGEEFTKAQQEKDFDKIVIDFYQIHSKLFVDLHNLDWKILSIDIETETEITPSYLLDRRIANSERIIEQNQLQDMSPLFQWLKEKKSILLFDKISIIHQDFHPHNIMLSEDGKAYVIDWPACYIGDFRQDLGWTLLLTGAYSTKPIRDMVLMYYEKARGSEVEDIEYFEILAAARRIMDILIFFKQSPETAGIREETIQQIKETVFHLEYIASFVKDKTSISIPIFDELIQTILKE